MSTSRLVPRLIVAALLAGLLLGLAGRLYMRFIALEAGQAGSYSTGGSLEVVAFGVLLGAPLAAAFWLLRSRLSLRPPGPGMVFGMLMVLGLVLITPPSAESALAATTDTPAFTLLGFGALFIAWGAALDLASRWVLRHPRRTF